MENNELNAIIRKYALVNATEHEGVAQPKSVLGRVLAEYPDLRLRVLEIKNLSERVCDEVNRLTTEKQKKELESVGPIEMIKKEERKGLPDLDINRDRVVMRFAPNPDGALHLGNARPAILCHEYVKKYKGLLILRFDDTDPKIKKPDKKYYTWIREDLKWLGIKWDKEVISSKRLNIYYKHAEALIKIGGAYVCTCSDAWKKLRDAGKPCPCRDASKETQTKKWKKMLSANTKPKNAYREGEAVLRIKTNMELKNPEARDWPAVRIVDSPEHPLGKKRVWPLYNFASAIDDHLLGVTHIMRGQEHATNEIKQRFVYQYFKWSYPFTIILGRISLSNMVLSKSEIREGIEKDIFRGWDDPKVGTIRSLRRRGYSAEAIRQIIMDIGPKPSDMTISLENLSAYNRKIIDKKANRYFFIHDPKKIEVTGLKTKNAKIALHPEEKRGFRNISLGKYFFVEKSDFLSCRGQEVRLMGLCNIKLAEKSKFTGTELKAVPKMHWLPSKFIKANIIMQEKTIKGIVETSIKKEKPGAIIQFERFGFCRLEKIGKKEIIAVFGHK